MGNALIVAWVIWLGARLAPGRPAWLSVVVAWVVPFLSWNWIMGWVVFMQHTHPEVGWFASRAEWTFFQGQILSTIQATFPPVMDTFSNHVMKHHAHHASPAIPLYRLADAQALLLAAYPEARTLMLTPRTLLRNLKACKLFDYQRRQWVDFDGIVALRLLQASRFRVPVGAINGSYLRAPPRIDDPRIGRSSGIPVALAFRIGEDCTGFPGGIGRVVHRELFPETPAFSVHIKFACAKTDLLGRSDFANPRSIWYNVFVGYYQVEVAQEEWGRPFGYDLDADGNGTLRLDEMARLVRADWNHLSNQIYGVPAPAVAAVNALGVDGLQFEYHGRVRKEGWDGAFDLADLENLVVVGPHSAHRGADYVNFGPFIGPLWRRVFGTYSGPVADASFAPCLLRTRAYFCFRSTRDATGRLVYQTFVFGGSVNHRHDHVDAAENARFLALQMDELERIIRGERGLGFADDAGARRKDDVLEGPDGRVGPDARSGRAA